MPLLHPHRSGDAQKTLRVLHQTVVLRQGMDIRPADIVNARIARGDQAAVVFKNKLALFRTDFAALARAKPATLRRDSTIKPLPVCLKNS